MSVERQPYLDRHISQPSARFLLPILHSAIMKVQNASTIGYGGTQTLTQNVSWVYPFLPGEPPGVLRMEFAGCIPSNITISELCCSAVNGQFVQSELTDVRAVNQTELRQILDDRYPGQNVTAWESARTGTLVNATGAGEEGAMHWCSMAYNPMSSDALQGVGWSSGGGMMGNVPDSVNDWIKCFNNNTSDEQRGSNEVAYICTVKDVNTGGQIQGYNQTLAIQAMQSQNGASRGEVGRWTGILAVAISVGLWSTML